MISGDGNSGSGVELQLSSGFTVNIKPLPPYYVDVIDELLPLPEFPTRKTVLAAGDIAEFPYDPTSDAKDPSHEDHQLYLKWKSVELKRVEVNKKRDKARKDFLLANCVTPLNGPVDFDDDDWVDRVEAAFEDFIVPEHRGKRMLVFLKTQVISTPEELELIISYALSREVSMQGIVRALEGFRSQMEKIQVNGRNHKTSQKRRRS